MTATNKKDFFRRACGLVLVLLAAPALSGCSSSREANNGMASLTTASYAEAESLMQQARPSITRETPIRIGPLTDMSSPSAQAPLGKMIGQQIGARLVQLGYNVQGGMMDGAPTPAQLMPQAAADPVAPPIMAEPLPPGEVDGYSGAWRSGNGGTGMLGRIMNRAAPAAGGNNGSAMIIGQYAEARDRLFVNLRIVDTQTNRMLAATDYTLPINRDIRELMRDSSKKSRFFGL